MLPKCKKVNMQFKNGMLDEIGRKDYNPMFIDAFHSNVKTSDGDFDDTGYEREILIKSDLTTENIDDKLDDEPIIGKTSKTLLVDEVLDDSEVCFDEVNVALVEQDIFDDVKYKNTGVDFDEDPSKENVITLVKDECELIDLKDEEQDFGECFEQEILIGSDICERANNNKSSISEDPNKYPKENDSSVTECKICFKQMKATSIRQHMQTHRGIKPFKCDICHQRFTRKTDRLRHMCKLHGVSNFNNTGTIKMKSRSCNLCSRTFDSNMRFQEHQKTHIKSNHYFCKICRFKCTKLEYFVNHTRYCHPPQERIDNLPETDRLHSIDDTSDVNYEESEGGDFDEAIDNVNSNSSPLKISLSEDTSSKSIVKSYEDEEYLEYPENIDSPSPVLDEDSNDSFFQCVDYDKTSNNSQELKRRNELVDKAVKAAIAQSEMALLDIQSSVKASKSLKTNVDLPKDKNVLLDSSKKANVKNSEIQIRANVGGQLHKFIIQIPAGNTIDASKPEGMEVLINMVNQLCAGKGDVMGSVEVSIRQNV